MREYNRAMGEEHWNEVGDYLENGSFVLSSSGLLHISLPQVGDIVRDLSSGKMDVFRTDGFGEMIDVGAFENSMDDGVVAFSNADLGLPRFGFGIAPIPDPVPAQKNPHSYWPWPPPYTPPPPVGTPDQCAARCKDGLDYCNKQVDNWEKTAWALWGLFCGGSGVGLGIACFGLCFKAGQGANPYCLAICLALTVVLMIGCGIAAKWIRDQVADKRKDCFDKYDECVRNCRKPKPKRSRTRTLPT